MVSFIVYQLYQTTFDEYNHLIVGCVFIWFRLGDISHGNILDMINGHATGTDLLEVPTIYKAYVSGLCFRAM